MNYIDIIIRIITASFAGSAIGYNREKINRPAGIRTHALLALGSAILTILSMDIFYDPLTKAGDPGRIAAQVVSGIGFLGAGTILKNGNKVKGLTTAATLWVSASIGITFGSGSYFIGSVALIITLIVLSFNKISKHLTDEVTIEIVLKENKSHKKILEKISETNFNLVNADLSQKDEGRLYFTFKNIDEKNISDIQKKLLLLDSIESLGILDNN
ncbi:methyltransferase [Tepiditoga spiralis]|uniref:Methyltransferase n=1 Tax=Tepiditoga spiralis TaxID=2108365 RepID=A0A7G1G6C8_9BACT|nr:MgtC/SapB family protein [Tepiditoga spiralis]BBE30417.1 methyltransferase [Tepiditoga spiralis]